MNDARVLRTLFELAITEIQTKRAVATYYSATMQPPAVRRGHTHVADGETVKGVPMANMIHRLNRLGRALVRHLPEKPYPSEHPWEQHHDRSRPRG